MSKEGLIGIHSELGYLPRGPAAFEHLESLVQTQETVQAGFGLSCCLTHGGEQHCLLQLIASL